ncbi:hypothetical protein BOTBODRAFT_181523 [Botryobasidium botryosum FD-172 SS1]|uniref:Uncharacterized protein n=1 Tax=Botryobasidium botryosum (strain FD-172 SS1) TaxID=930990 RepID=A0A067LTV0_BOTB1|nr:hypothetical protein BOTBODRAFT_181523 [Botryobasidium botryosum FD-172 SS1]
MLIAASSKNCKEHFDADNPVVAPKYPAVSPTVTGTLTSAQTKENRLALEDLTRFREREGIAQQLIISMIDRGLAMRVMKKTKAADMWTIICNEFNGRTSATKQDMQRRLHNLKCADNGNVRTHLEQIFTLTEELASMGEAVPDEQLVTIITKSLPPSYNAFLNTLTLMSEIVPNTTFKLDSAKLITFITQEYERRSLNAKTRGGNQSGLSNGSTDNESTYPKKLIFQALIPKKINDSGGEIKKDGAIKIEI